MPKKSQDVQSESTHLDPVTAASSAAKPARKRKKSASAKKKAAKKSARPRAPRQKSAETTSSPSARPRTEPTDEQVRLRAYFLGERRAQLSLPGDSDHDWLEARRQLFEEAGLPLDQ